MLPSQSEHCQGTLKEGSVVTHPKTDSPPHSLFICFGCKAWGILIPPPGIKPVLSMVEARNPNHWTVREIPPAQNLTRWYLPWWWQTNQVSRSLWAAEESAPGGVYTLTETMNLNFCFLATHSSILGWKIPWTKEPGGPCSGKRVGRDWAHARTYYYYMRIDNTLGCKAYLGTRDLHGFQNSYSTEGGVSDSSWSQNHEQWPGSCFPSFPRAPLSACSFDLQGNSAKEFKTNSSSQN